jgi:hypothetical protein
MGNGLPENALFVCLDCGIKKGSPTQYTADDLAVATDAILAALRDAEGRV